MTSLPRVKLISLTYVSIGTSLRRLKLGGLNYVPMKRHKDVSNRSLSFTDKSQRRDDVSAGSATSRPIWDLNETSLQRFVRGGIKLLILLMFWVIFPWYYILLLLHFSNCSIKSFLFSSLFFYLPIQSYLLDKKNGDYKRDLNVEMISINKIQSFWHKQLYINFVNQEIWRKIG